ncbi:MAG: hypothetical protein IJZ03_07650 [Clostridia bacterium]|nr:hypothetical protein [Clostridia bacterium]
MDLYRKQGYQIVRLCLYQFGMTLFGLVVAMATRSPKALFIACGIFSALFYLYLIYSLVYELGQKDGLRIEAGRRTYKPLTGFWLALAANSLNILLGILSFIGKTVFDANGAAWAENLYGIANAAAKFIQGMYVALLTLIMDASYANLLTPIPGIIVCTVAYILGVKYCHGVRPPKEEKRDRYYPNISDPREKRK